MRQKSLGINYDTILLLRNKIKGRKGVNTITPITTQNYNQQSGDSEQGSTDVCWDTETIKH